MKKQNPIGTIHEGDASYVLIQGTGRGRGNHRSSSRRKDFPEQEIEA